MGERKVLISVDGSKPADHAFKWYLKNMRRENDLIYLVHCAEYHVAIGLPGRAADVDAITKGMKAEEDRIRNMLGNYMEDLKKEMIHAKEVLLQGQKPGEAIVKTAGEENIHHIIMGSRGLGKIRRTFMGSVSDYVVHHAPTHCSVTIVRDQD